MSIPIDLNRWLRLAGMSSIFTMGAPLLAPFNQGARLKEFLRVRYSIFSSSRIV